MSAASPTRLLIIGSSTGAPPVLHELLSLLPAPFPMPIVIAHHILAGFEHGLVDWLSATGHPIALVREVLPLRDGRVYLAPGDRNIEIAGGELPLVKPRPAKPAQLIPSVDQLMLTAAAAFGDRVIACLLTGMGSDGAQGMLAIRRAGGVTIAQLAATCSIDGMPRSARALGAVQLELSPQEMASHLSGLALEAAAA